MRSVRAGARTSSHSQFQKARRGRVHSERARTSGRRSGPGSGRRCHSRQRQRDDDNGRPSRLSPDVQRDRRGRHCGHRRHPRRSRGGVTRTGQADRRQLGQSRRRHRGARHRRADPRRLRADAGRCVDHQPRAQRRVALYRRRREVQSLQRPLHAPGLRLHAGQGRQELRLPVPSRPVRHQDRRGTRRPAASAARRARGGSPRRLRLREVPRLPPRRRRARAGIAPCPRSLDGSTSESISQPSDGT